MRSNVRPGFGIRRVAVQCALMVALVAVPAAAQQSARDATGIVYGLVGGGVGDGTFVATGAGAGLRVTRHLGLDVELTHLSGSGGAVAPERVFGGFSAIGPAVDPVFPSFRIEDEERDVTTFLTRLTVEFPVANGRLVPYLTGGGGVGRVTERFSIVLDAIPLIPLRPAGTEATDHAPGGANTIPFPGRLDISPGNEHSDLGLSLVLGGGVDVRLWRGLGVGVDIRWLRILRSYGPLDTAQATSRVSYRF